MGLFEQLYAEVPFEQREELRRFRSTHPPKRVIVDETGWTYFVGGQGATTILWLVGGLRRADAAYRSIPLLEDQFRIIAPDYPPTLDMLEMADGLSGMLEVEGVQQAHILAGSFGGMVAQVFMREYPEQVAKVILSTTTAPDASQAARYTEIMSFLQMSDQALVREMAQPQMFAMIAPPEAELQFWRAYVRELFEYRLGKEDLLSLYRCMIDFMRMQFTPSDFAAWGERILLIDSADDATFGATEQRRLQALYPAAKVHTFSQAGHSPASTQRDVFFDLARTFFSI
jgi:pimeloyl-ACP methyl ester carboxylesterase